MKTIWKVTVAGALMAAAMIAQRPFATGGTPPDPATAAQNQVARLTTLLSLTTTQAGQATTIFTNAATSTAALQTTLSTDRDSLQSAVKSNSTANIDSLSATIGTLTGQILDIQSKATAAFRAILTTDQLTKLDQLGGGGFGGPGGPGGPGGFGGPGGGPPPGRP